MANQYEDDDDYDFAEDNGPANLRKALKKAEKDRKELEEQLSSLKSNLRQRSVKDVLEAKGVNSKIATFIPSNIEAPEAIAAWLDEHADVFGFQSELQNSEPALTEDARSDQRINQAVNSSSSPSGEEDIMNRLANVNSREELDQLVFGKSMGR